MDVEKEGSVRSTDRAINVIGKAIAKHDQTRM